MRAVALLAKGADVVSARPMAPRPCIGPCYNDDADLVERLIKAGADVSAVNDYGA